MPLAGLVRRAGHRGDRRGLPAACAGRADDGPPRLQALEATAAPTPRAGIHVERLLAGADLAARGDDALLDAALVVVDGVRAHGTTGGAPVPGTRVR
jgi:hypothetical protein